MFSGRGERCLVLALNPAGMLHKEWPPNNNKPRAVIAEAGAAEHRTAWHAQQREHVLHERAAAGDSPWLAT